MNSLRFPTGFSSSTAFLTLPFLLTPLPHSAIPWLGIPEAAAQENMVDSRERSVRAFRTDSSITIDGRLDEEAWESAEAVSGFIQESPRDGESAMQDTEVRLLYDDSNLYIGARLFESDPSDIAAQLTRRGVTGRAAGYFEFSIDSNRDRITGYQFRVTAAGVQRDRYLFNDTRSDDSWNGVWESAVTHTDDGWIAEVRMPLSQLRYEAPSAGEEQEWGVNFARRRISDNERSSWAWTPSGTFGTVSRFGQLEGLQLPQQSRRLEIIPYATSGLEVAPSEPGDPFFDGREFTGQVGADIRYGLGSTFMADIAVNPDFGQVEVDPQVVNLSAFETFFPEQRPFFTRDDRIFDFGLAGFRDTLFHSRRIGRSPQGPTPSDADFISVPGDTSILGAGKITGRTLGGLSLGALAAVTEREHGRAHFTEQEETRRFEVEPQTNYGLLRAQQDLRDGASRMGGILTLVDRDLPDNGRMDFLPRQAITGGLDFEHSWADRLWALDGYLAASHVSGSEEAMLRLQRSSGHYHQRPDQDYLTLDPEATSLSGTEWQLRLNNRSGRDWSGSVSLSQRNEGFEVNDLGFQSGNEQIRARSRLQYNEPDPNDWFQNYRFTITTEQQWRNSALHGSSWSDAMKENSVDFDARFTFLNWWSISLDSSFEEEVLSDTLTRGGPLMIQPGSREFGFSFSTDRRDDVTWGASVDYADGLRGGRDYSISVDVEARPTNGILLSADLSYERSRDVSQYVTRVDDESFDPTFGGRYFFADLDREELSLDLRANVIFSPDLSLEIFAQPLISAGDFTAYKQLARPSSFDFQRFSEGQAAPGNGNVACQGGNLCRQDGRIHVDYTGDGMADSTFREQNFNIRSLRGNAVLRWEYRPGSRLYLVWQHTRQLREALGDLDFQRDARALFEGSGEHMFMIKLDYWLDI